MIGGEVTRYLDDVVVLYPSMEPGYVIREIDLSMSLSRIHWVCTCVLVIIVILVRGVIVVGEVVLLVIVIERQG